MDDNCSKNGPKTAKFTKFHNNKISDISSSTQKPKKHVHGPRVLCARVLDTQQQKYQYSIYLPTYLSIYLPVYLPSYLSTYLSIYLFIYLSIYLSIWQYAMEKTLFSVSVPIISLFNSWCLLWDFVFPSHFCCVQSVFATIWPSLKFYQEAFWQMVGAIWAW